MSRRLPRAFLDPWDAWLQACMQRSREQLGDGWLDLYLTGPIWRFSLSAAVCGPEAWCGVMIPSVDRVGRYFPLTIATPAGDDANPFGLARDLGVWFERAEDLALSMLDDDAPSFEDFDAAVESLAEVDGTCRTTLWPLPEAGALGAWRLPLSAGLDPAGVYPALLGQAIPRAAAGLSLWWTDGAGEVEPSLCVCAGLPPSEGFAAWLNGRWDAGSWQDLVGRDDAEPAGAVSLVPLP